MKKTGEKDFNVPQYVSGDAYDINVVFGDKPSNKSRDAVVIRFDLFRTNATNALDRMVLLPRPGVRRMDEREILSEVRFRLDMLEEAYREKDVVLEIYISQKDIADDRRLRYLEVAFSRIDEWLCEAKISHDLILEPLGTSLKRRMPT